MDVFNENLKKSYDYENLKKSYDNVGNQIFEDLDFIGENLKSSLNLFEVSSIAKKVPIPKKLEVIALLSGLPFSTQALNYFSGIQNDINEIIPDALKYWVEPQNMGVEYLVLKWPDMSIDINNVNLFKDYLSSLSIPKFNIVFSGVQIHRDGCMVMRGFDENKSLQKLREQLRGKFDFIPERQSAWCHVPIGRILEPVGMKQFSKLKDYLSSTGGSKHYSEEINLVSLIYETRWYMIERQVLQTYRLS